MFIAVLYAVIAIARAIIQISNSRMSRTRKAHYPNHELPNYTPTEYCYIVDSTAVLHPRYRIVENSQGDRILESAISKLTCRYFQIAAILVGTSDSSSILLYVWERLFRRPLYWNFLTPIPFQAIYCYEKYCKINIVVFITARVVISHRNNNDWSRSIVLNTLVFKLLKYTGRFPP